MPPQFDESGDDYDLDLDQRTRGIGGRSGRIIILGDGTEVLTDSDETEMFDHDEEDKDVDSVSSSNDPSGAPRSEREGTPAPPSKSSGQTGQTSASADRDNTVDSLSSTATEKSPVSPELPKTHLQAAADSDLPTKLVNPPTQKP